MTVGTNMILNSKLTMSAPIITGATANQALFWPFVAQSGQTIAPGGTISDPTGTTLVWDISQSLYPPLGYSTAYGDRLFSPFTAFSAPVNGIYLITLSCSVTGGIGNGECGTVCIANRNQIIGYCTLTNNLAAGSGGPTYFSNAVAVAYLTAGPGAFGGATIDSTVTILTFTLLTALP